LASLLRELDPRVYLLCTTPSPAVAAGAHDFTGTSRRRLATLEDRRAGHRRRLLAPAIHKPECPKV